MAISVEAEDLYAEIRSAEQFRDLHIGKVPELIQRYVGGYYRDDWTMGAWPENAMYEYIRVTASKIIFDNPKVRVKTRRPGTQRMVAKAMQHGLNRWIHDVSLRRILKRAFVNELFAFQVLQTTVERQPWMDPRAGSMDYWPNVYQLQRKRFFFDPFCEHYTGARFAGHKFVLDKDDLLRMAESKSSGWDKSKINELSTSSVREAHPDTKTTGEVAERNEIIGYEVWIPEIQTRDTSDGFHGTIYTLAASPAGSGEPDSVGMIREPRAFYGPRWGPYTLYGVYPVPGDPFPLSPFTATYAQTKDLNDVVTAIVTAICRYKRVVFVDSNSTTMAQKIKESPDAFVVPVPNLEKDRVVNMEFGGISQNHMEQLRQALERVDRNTGITDPQRGNVTPRATATAIAVSDAASNDMIAFVKQEFTDNTVQLLNSVGWYMFSDDRIRYPLGEDAASDLMMGEPWFEGGAGPSERYEDLELEIEPYSMQRQNEALARANYKELIELVIQAAPIIPQTPYINWDLLFERGGDATNDPVFAEALNMEVARQFAGALSGQQPGAAPSNGPQSVKAPFLGETMGRHLRERVGAGR